MIGVPHKSTIGQYLKPGKPFFEIGDPKKLEAHLILDQTDVDLINSRNPNNKPIAWVKVYGTSREDASRATSARSPSATSDEIPPELSNVAGGEIATKQDEKTGQVKPLTAVFEVIIPVDNADLHAPARPSRLRQDRRRPQHARLVALANGGHQDLPLHALIRSARRSISAGKAVRQAAPPFSFRTGVRDRFHPSVSVEGTEGRAFGRGPLRPIIPSFDFRDLPMDAAATSWGLTRARSAHHLRFPVDRGPSPPSPECFFSSQFAWDEGLRILPDSPVRLGITESQSNSGLL